MKRQWLLTFLSLLLLWVLVTQLNHYLAVWHSHIFVGALYLTFAALRLPVRGGMLVTALGGLLCDANTPVPFGTHMLLFTVAHAFINKAQHRIPSDHPTTQLVVAFIANLVLYVALSVVVILGNPVVGQLWPRLLFDLALSQVCLLLLGPWFLALQARILELDRYAMRSRF